MMMISVIIIDNFSFIDLYYIIMFKRCYVHNPTTRQGHAKYKKKRAP